MEENISVLRDSRSALTNRFTAAKTALRSWSANPDNLAYAGYMESTLNGLLSEQAAYYEAVETTIADLLHRIADLEGRG